MCTYSFYICLSDTVNIYPANITIVFERKSFPYLFQFMLLYIRLIVVIYTNLYLLRILVNGWANRIKYTLPSLLIAVRVKQSVHIFCSLGVHIAYHLFCIIFYLHLQL